MVPHNDHDHEDGFRVMRTERDIDGCPVKEGCFDPAVRDTYTPTATSPLLSKSSFLQSYYYYSL
jgi:hypothetical protein